MPIQCQGWILGDSRRLSPAEIALYTNWPGLSLDHIAAGTGLSGEYFDNINLTGLKVKRIDPTINFEWKADKPAPEIGADTFSVRWQGWVKPKVSGPHTFFTLSDDGVRLWVNGQLLIDQWTDHAPTEHSGQISLQAGQKVEIKIEFFENAGSATIKLSWSAPGLAKEIVPATQLYPRDLFDVHLDAVYGQLVAGGWVVLSSPAYQEVYQIESLTEDSRSDFTVERKDDAPDAERRKPARKVQRPRARHGDLRPK